MTPPPTYSPRIRRMWINCPSSHCKICHQFHGRNVLADHNSIIVASDRVILSGTKLIDVYFLDGDRPTATIPLAHLADGWKAPGAISAH